MRVGIAADHAVFATKEPQYLIKSDKTDHMAMHKGAALKMIGVSDHVAQKQLAHSKKK